MKTLTEVLNELDISLPSRFEKGKVYTIYKRMESTPDVLVGSSMEYSGKSKSDDHLFFNHFATSRLNMNWKYFKDKDLKNYIFKLNNKP